MTSNSGVDVKNSHFLLYMATLITNSSPFLEPLDYANQDANAQANIDAQIIAGDEFLRKSLNRILLQDTYTDEKHDGNGRKSIFVSNPPIISLTDIDIVSTDFNGNETTTTLTATKFDLKLSTGEIRFKPGSFTSDGASWFTEGFQNIQITYSGGFVADSNSLKPMELVLAEFVIEMFDPNEAVTGIEKEKLGDYFYSRGTNAWDKLLVKHSQIMKLYKIVRVNSYRGNI